MTNMQQGRAISGSAYRPMGDQHLLNYPPCPVDAVKWSEDNLIAVAAGHTAVIASPADITGPRGYAVIRTDSMPADLGCKPSCYENSVAIGLSCMLQSGPTGHTATSVRGLCWSPAGCTASGSCLLTLVASDGKVQIFGPPSAPLAARWELLVNLSDRLLQHMSDSNWQDAEQAAAAAVPGSEPLRLRGGGGGSKAKSQRKQQTAADHMDADTAGQQQQQQDLTAGAAAGDKEATTADLPPAKRQKRAADALMQKAGSQPQQASEPAAKNIPSSVPAADAPHKTHEQQRAKGYRGSKAAADVQATGSTGKLSAGNKSKKQGAADGAAATEATAVNPAEAAQGSTVTKKASKAMPGRRKSAAAAAAAAATGSNGSSGAKQADVTAAAAATVSVKAPGKKRGRKSAADKAAEAAAAALTPAASNKTQGNGSVAEDVADSADATAADKDGKDKDATDVQQQKSSKAGTSTKTPSSKKAAGKKASTPAADKTAKTPAGGKGSSKPTAGKPPKSSSKKSSAAGAKTSVARASSVTPSRDATPDPNAHLPRTAAGAAVFAVGDAVEVMNDEEGLRGAWWAGKILQLQHGFALVEYASLYEDEEGTQALKEWFPVPGPGPAADPDAGAAAAGGYYFHTDLSNMLRPQPPQEMLSPPGGKPQPGDCVEVYVDDGWWRTRVLSATAVAVTAPVGSATNIVTVPIQGGVRSLTVWDPDDGIWDYGVLIQHPPGTTAPPAGAEPPAAAAPTDKQPHAAEQPDATAKAPKAAAKPRRGSAAGTKNWVEDYVPDIPGFSSDDDEDDAKPRGAGRGSAAAAAGRKGGKKKRRRAASGSDSGSDWAAESAQEESDDHELSSDVEEEQESEGAEESEPEGSDDLEVGVSRKGSSRKAGGIKLVSATAILPADKAQKPVAGRRLPHLSATAAGAAAAGTALGLAAAAAAAAAARAGASQPTGAADDVEMVDAQGPAAAASVGGSAAVAEDGDVAGPLSAAGKRSASKKKGSKSSKSAGSQIGDGDEDDAAEDAESDGWVTEEEEGDPEAEYKVPDGLDANTYVSLLPAGMTLDTADGWKKGAPRAMTVRFAQLREKLDPKKLPHYKKGQHLRKADMRLWTQVLAEFLHLHGKDLDARTDITTKQLVTLAKAAIRKSVIQSYSPYVRTDTANPYLTQGYVPRGAAAGAAAGSNRNPSSILQQAMSAAASEGPKRKVAGQKRKKDADAESVAAATLLAAAVEVGSVGPIGPVNLVAAAAEEQPEVASSVVLSQQVPGVEVQLSSSVRTGPSLKLQVNTVVSARDAYARCYAPYAAYARNNCSFQVLEGSMIETSSWECRRTFMAATAAAWSQTCVTAVISSGEGAAADGQEQQKQQRYTLLAVGCKAGCVQLWRYKLPLYSSSTDAADAPDDVALQYLGAVGVTSGANVTSLIWTVLPATPPTTAAAAGGAIGSSSCVVPGAVANKLAGDVLLLAVGTSVGEITLWSADPAAADAAAALQQLGTPLLPDQQTVLVQDLAVLASATTAVADDSSSSSWQLLLAAGKPLGRVAVWRSGHIISKLMSDPATAVAEGGQTTCSMQAYSQQQLSLAISGGSSSSMRCHGAGFVTGVMWNPWEQLLCTSGADGQVLMWTWENDNGVRCGRAPCRFNRQWLRPAPSSALAPARRAVAPVSGLAGSGARLCMAVARDWHVTLAAGELDAVAGAGGGGVRTNASAWEKVTQGALQLMSCYGPTDTAALEHVLLKQLVPALMWQGAVQAVLPAAAMWDVAVAIARCGWQSLKEPQQQQQQQQQLEPASAALVAPADDAEAAAAAIAAAAAEESKQSKGKKRKNATDAAGSSEDVAGVEALNARAELISKMAKKQAREIKLQCELLWRVVQAATAVFDATVAASGQQNSSSTATAPDGSTSAAVQVYRSSVPAAAWVGLQLACYLTRCFLKLWEGPQASQVSLLSEVGQLVIQLEQLLARWELELLQKHVYYGLTQGVGYCLEQQAVGKLVDAQQQYVQQQQQHAVLELPAAGVAAAAAPGSLGSLGSLPLSEVLLADFVSQNIRHPDLNVEELLRPAAAVYASYGLMAPIGSASQSCMPARELNPVDPNNLPPVSVSGQGVAALSIADVHLAAQAADADSMEHDGRGTAVMKWPRCSSTMMLCQAVSSNSGSCWGCSNCGRRYAVPPSKALVQALSGHDHKATHSATAVSRQLCVPACLACGCRLSPGGAPFTGMPGATVRLKQTLDGAPVIGVGISLSDMLLPGC